MTNRVVTVTTQQRLTVHNERGTTEVVRDVVRNRVVSVGIQGPPGPLIENLDEQVAFATTVDIDVSLLKRAYELVVTGDCTLEVVNGTAEQHLKPFLLHVKRDGGEWAVTFGASFLFGRGFQTVPLSPPGEYDLIGFFYNHDAQVAYVVSFAPGYDVS